jgi:uncharacterized protein YxeA
MTTFLINNGGKMKKIIITIPIMIVVIAISLGIVYLTKATATPANAKYISDKKCYFCHKPETRKHINSTHANSFKSLVDNGQDKNPKCLPCHTTGYGKPGGFVDVKSTPDMKDVGCQACHGPGSLHIENGLSKELRRQTINLNPCQNCHEIHKEHPDINKKK